MQTPRISAHLAPVMAMTVIIVAGSVAAASFSWGTSPETGTGTTASSIPSWNRVLPNASGFPTVTSSGERAPTYPPAYFPSGPPRVYLFYQNMPFAGFQGSYCWPPPGWGETTSCVDRAPPSPASIPTVAVYPRPALSFETYHFWRQLQGFTVSVYRESPLTEVFSGQVGSVLHLNFTSGNYLVWVYAQFEGADVSSCYNLTTVSSPAFHVDKGVSVQLGTPATHSASLVNPEYTVSGVFWEDWPVTVRSNVTTDVELNATSVISGAWVEFVPSHLTGVGPDGAQARMILAGGVGPFVNNDESNVSMIIQARGENGALGQVLLPVEGTEYVAPIRSGSPVNATLSPRNPFRIFQNQTNYDWFIFVYDPGGAPSNGSLAEDFTIVGMINGSTVSGIPNWLKLALPSSSLTLVAYAPAFLQVAATTTPDAPVGDYAFLLRGVIGGRASYFVAPLWVSPPISMGP